MGLMPISGSGITSEYEISEGKADTYLVEADNTELGHYLAGKSRCFSRCPYTLECALRLFVFCFNRRQLYKQRFPHYHAHVMDFLSPLFLDTPSITSS